MGNQDLPDSGGSIIARLKLKGIGGRVHQRWMLRFNLIQRGIILPGYEALRMAKLKTLPI